MKGSKDKDKKAGGKPKKSKEKTDKTDKKVAGDISSPNKRSKDDLSSSPKKKMSDQIKKFPGSASQSKSKSSVKIVDDPGTARASQHTMKENKDIGEVAEESEGKSSAGRMK